MTNLTKAGTLNARAMKRAQILLKADASPSGPGWSDEAIAQALEVHPMTVGGVRKRYGARGLESVLQGQYTGHNPAIVTAEVEAHLIALACSEPPEGRERWTMQLLADKLVSLEIVEQDRSAGARKNELKPWLKQEWCIPPKENAAFVSQMEDMLDVYQAQYSPRNPLVCMDESNKQLLADTRESLPAAPGQAVRYDHEYKRNGTGNLFLAFAPLSGWRTVTVTERRTKQDWAHFMKDLVDIHFPEAETITVVLDNLNTHTWASLYETFPAPEAHRCSGCTHNDARALAG